MSNIGLPNNDEVICPNCVHQFRAIPVNAQTRIAELEGDLHATRYERNIWKNRAEIYMDERDARIVELEAQRNRATYEVSSLLKELSALRARIAKLEAALNRANVELQRLHSGELPGGWTAALEAEVAARHKAKDALVLARTITDEQAEDEGLWFDAQTAPEAYLQRALRRLHAAVEGER